MEEERKCSKEDVAPDKESDQVDDVSCIPGAA